MKKNSTKTEKLEETKVNKGEILNPEHYRNAYMNGEVPKMFNYFCKYANRAFDIPESSTIYVDIETPPKKGETIVCVYKKGRQMYWDFLEYAPTLTVATIGGKITKEYAELKAEAAKCETRGVARFVAYPYQTT